MRNLFVNIFAAVLLIGCSSLSTEPPVNYNLTGHWKLNNALSDSPNLASLGRGAGRRNPGAGNRSRGEGGRGQGRGPQGGGRTGGRQRGGVGTGTQIPVVVQVLAATEMNIEQNDDSMGVDYKSGIYRDVGWGERKRGQLVVTSGWKEDDLVIETKGGRSPIEEIYVLSDDGARLTVLVELDGGKNDMVFTRVFDKQEAPRGSEI